MCWTTPDNTAIHHDWRSASSLLAFIPSPSTHEHYVESSIVATCGQYAYCRDCERGMTLQTVLRAKGCIVFWPLCGASLEGVLRQRKWQLQWRRKQYLAFRVFRQQRPWKAFCVACTSKIARKRFFLLFSIPRFKKFKYSIERLENLCAFVEYTPRDGHKQADKTK